MGVDAQLQQRFIEVPFDGNASPEINDRKQFLRVEEQQPLRKFMQHVVPGNTVRFNSIPEFTPLGLVKTGQGIENYVTPGLGQHTTAFEIPDAKLFQQSRTNQQVQETPRQTFKLVEPVTVNEVQSIQPLQLTKQLEKQPPTPSQFQKEDHRFVGIPFLTRKQEPTHVFHPQPIAPLHEPLTRKIQTKPHEQIAFLGRVQPTPPPQLFKPRVEQATNNQQRFSNAPLLTTRGNAAEHHEQLFREQAENAHYSFASQVDDSINDQQLHREETRDGEKVTGMYSSSDGFFKRTTHYEADKNGFRIISVEEEPLGNGPSVNPNGQANVRSIIDGNDVNYSITSADIPKLEPLQIQKRF